MNFKLVLFSFLFLSNSFSQGPVDGFFKSKNELDLAASASYNSAPKYFAGTKLINYPRNQSIVSLYGNYGLSKRWNLILSLPLINFKPQDIAIYGKFKLIAKRFKKSEWSVFPSFGVSVPTWKYETQSGQAIGQRAVQFQPILVTQLKWDKGLFIQGQTHYNYALQPVPSSVNASFKIGFAGNKFYYDVWYDYQNGFGDKDYQGTVSFDSFRELVTSYQRVGGVAYYTINPKLGTFINGSYTFLGRNMSQSLNIGAGIVFKLKTGKKAKS